MRDHPSQRPMWLLVAALLAGAGLGAYSSSLLVGADRSAEQNHQLLCEAVNGGRATVRNLLVAARNQTPRSRLNKRARTFYREQIRAVRPLGCGNFDRDSLRREQRRAARHARGGDATSRPTAGAPP
jgi:hypothetical protein